MKYDLRRIDVLVAEHVMGRKVRSDAVGEDPHVFDEPRRPGWACLVIPQISPWPGQCWRPSTSTGRSNRTT